MKAIGFNLGQRGDLAINTCAARVYKELFPNSKLIMGVHSNYSDMLPLFENHDYFDGFHIYESYNDWPNKTDSDYLKSENYDIVFNGMPKNTSFSWFTYAHQTQEVCLMHGLRPPNNLQCSLNQWFPSIKHQKTIAFAPFGGWYNKNNTKKLSFEFAQIIVNEILKFGYQILQIGGSDEPKLENAIKLDCCYFDTIKHVLGCDCLIHSDTGIGWVISAYSFPQLGLYSNDYYVRNGVNYIRSIQPVNPNSIYLDENNVNQIKIEKILENLKKLLL